MRKSMLGGFGGTKGTERAVAAALNWFARHQNPDGSWSIHRFDQLCKDGRCTGVGAERSDSAATALALLPFLAAGQTHRTRGPYQKTIDRGLTWLIDQQKPDGNLAGATGQVMYSHGLAAIVLCEAYGLSKAPGIGSAAQKAIRFIQNAQNPTNGGWRYVPKTESSDTSVFGWQLMALKSAQMAGLDVDPKAIEGAKKWLSLAAKGESDGLFSYEVDGDPTPSMTAVGLLCSQYLGAHRADPAIKEGIAFLMARLPDPKGRNSYYWYYAAQVVHNTPGPDWDRWNRHTRRVLIESQVKEGCAAGSWDPEKPVRDAFGEVGGRIMTTSLCTLILEVYYRYLPLYQLESRGVADPRTAQAPPSKPAARAPAEAKKAP